MRLSRTRRPPSNGPGDLPERPSVTLAAARPPAQGRAPIGAARSRGRGRRVARPGRDDPPAARRPACAL